MEDMTSYAMHNTTLSLKPSLPPPLFGQFNLDSWSRMDFFMVMISGEVGAMPVNVG